MENYPSYSYPDSSNSSPRAHDIDFENPPPSWEDQPPSLQGSKVKLMVSYGGKIQPRTHDNVLSYVGGETKIMSIERNVKFTSLFTKLSCILSSDGNGNGNGNGNSNSNSNDMVSGFTLKYQLPGEDLDALISVSNDDDLENMMHEYDRLCRGSSKPARLRVFLFPVLKSSSFGSTSSDKIDRESDRFVVEELNSGSVLPIPPPQAQVNSSIDYLFGLEKSPVQPPIPVQIPVQRHEPDPQIDARIQELNRMQISVQEMNRVNTDDRSLLAGAPVGNPIGYWQQHQQPPSQQQQQQFNIEQSQPPTQQHHVLPHFQQQTHHYQQPHQIQQHPQQQVYVLHAPPQGNVYHAPIMRQLPTNQQPPPQQGYYREQVYREQPVYSVGPGKYSEGMGVPVKPVTSMESNVGYQQQVGYDKNVYYGPQLGSGGLVTAPFQGVSGEMRNVGSSGSVPLDAKVAPK